jgi:hypothetical protein
MYSADNGLPANSEIEVLADQFAESVPEKLFSHAAIQGYLLQHPDAPESTLKNVGSLVRGEQGSSQSPDVKTGKLS